MPFRFHLIGLGNLGLGRLEIAKEYLQRLVQMDINHWNAQIHLTMADTFLK